MARRKKKSSLGRSPERRRLFDRVPAITHPNVEALVVEEMKSSKEGNPRMWRGVALDIAESLGTAERVLSVGSGIGFSESWMAKYMDGVRIIGLDSNPELVSHAQRTYGERSNLTFVRGTVYNLVEYHGSMNAIVAESVFHHFDNLPAALEQLFQTLVPGGKLYVSTLAAPERGQRFHPNFLAKLSSFVKGSEDPRAEEFMEKWFRISENGSERTRAQRSEGISYMSAAAAYTRGYIEQQLGLAGFESTRLASERVKDKGIFNIAGFSHKPK